MTYETGVAYGCENLEDNMLTKMWEHAHGSEWGDDGVAFGLRFFEPLHKEVARGMLRKMCDEGKVHFVKGLWSEDGEPRGAGYALTMQTVDEFKRMEQLMAEHIDTCLNAG